MFLTSTGLDLEIVDFARKRNVVAFPGAMTATEIMLAWKAGCDFVKVSPGSLSWSGDLSYRYQGMLIAMMR
jgi:2-keto-3-deoxy-6-phosphogluconate aldolase